MVMTRAEKSRKRLISINWLVSKKCEVADSLPRPTSLRAPLGPSLDLRCLLYFLVKKAIGKWFIGLIQPQLVSLSYCVSVDNILHERVADDVLAIKVKEADALDIFEHAGGLLETRLFIAR